MLAGFQKMWGMETVDLLSNRHILPPEEILPPRPKLQAEAWNSINCSTDIFRQADWFRFFAGRIVIKEI
jgi:protein transport protein SEC24